METIEEKAKRLAAEVEQTEGIGEESLKEVIADGQAKLGKYNKWADDSKEVRDSCQANAGLLAELTKRAVEAYPVLRLISLDDRIDLLSPFVFVGYWLRMKAEEEKSSGG